MRRMSQPDIEDAVTEWAKARDLERARAAVAEWRAVNPAGTVQQLIAAVGPGFGPGWAAALLAVVDRQQARKVTGITGAHR